MLQLQLAVNWAVFTSLTDSVCSEVRALGWVCLTFSYCSSVSYCHINGCFIVILIIF